MSNHPLTHRSDRRPTKAEKLLSTLSDGEQHSTRELSRRVGHTFAVAKWKLVRPPYSLHIEKEPHPTKPGTVQYFV